IVLCHSTVTLLALVTRLFFLNDPATPEIYTLSLHDALPIWNRRLGGCHPDSRDPVRYRQGLRQDPAARSRGTALQHGRYRTGSRDRKSTRLNSSHDQISYAVFCLKKKKYSSMRSGATMFSET